MYHVLFRDPLVGVAMGGDGLEEALDHTLRLAGGGPAHLFIAPSWTVGTQIRRIAPAVNDAAARNPKLKVIIFAAVESDMRVIADAGFEPILMNHNAFLDERLYFPTGTAKRYDAVHVARLLPWKRHELAYETPRMALISASYDMTPGPAAEIRNGYRDLAFSNIDEAGARRHLSLEEVRDVLSASWCGLSLSEVEGPVYAFSEYGLCGLPAVSTPARGGRELFFDGDYVEIAAPEPAAVAAAVARLKAAPPDPFEVRARTLARFRPHRARMIQRLSAIIGSDLTPLADPNLWLPQFVDKLRVWTPFEAS